MKTILMKMDAKVAHGLTNIQGITVDEEGKKREQETGFNITRWIDKSTVEVAIAADDVLMDLVVAEPEKKLDISGLCKIDIKLQKPELVKKLEGWPVEVPKEELEIKSDV